MSDDRSIGCEDHFATVVDVLLEIGQMALRAQRSGPIPPDGVIQDELQRLIREIECYLDRAGPPWPSVEAASPAQPECVPIPKPAVVRTFADLPMECKLALIKAAPGVRLKVPEKMPRPSNDELRNRYWELRRVHVPRTRAYKIVAKGAGRSWTRIRDIVSNRDERRRKRLKRPTT